MTDFRTIHDSRVEQPAAIDTTSSATTVYERKNIRQEATTMEMGGDPVQIMEWVYEQREYTQEEYAAMHSPATQTIMQAISDLELSVAMIGIE